MSNNKSSNSFENKHTSEDLKIMQSWSLQRKIQVTQTRIIEWYEKNDGKVYVSFSGGKDSTVLLDLVEGLSFGVENAKISRGLFDMAKCIDGVIKDESEGDNNDRQRTAFKSN